MKVVKLKIYGRVQGVFFRQSATHHAKKLGLSGWARNVGDGTVEILAQGEDASLQKFIQWCHRGPILAKVEKVEILPLEEPDPHDGFHSIS